MSILTLNPPNDNRSDGMMYLYTDCYGIDLLKSKEEFTAQPKKDRVYNMLIEVPVMEILSKGTRYFLLKGSEKIKLVRE